MCIIGYLVVKFRGVQVVITKDDLQLPCLKIESIPWCDIVAAGEAEVRVSGSATYLGIVLTPEARERVKQPKIVKIVGLLAGVISGMKCDILVNDMLMKGGCGAIVQAINERATGTLQ